MSIERNRQSPLHYPQTWRISVATIVLGLLVGLIGPGPASAQFGTVDLQVNRSYRLGTIDGMVPQQGQRTVRPRVPSGNWVDYWFDIPGQRRIVIQTPGNHVGAALFDRNQRFLRVTQNGFGERTVHAGEYFVRIFGNADTNNGTTVTIRADVQSTNDSAGNAFSAARYLGAPANPPTRVQEFVGQQDFWDYYRFDVKSTSEINVRVTPQFDGVNLVLYNRQRQRLTSTDFSSIRYRNAAPGTYYLLAQIKDQTPSGNNTRYVLDVGTIPQAPAPAPQTLCRSDASNVPQTACPAGPSPGIDVSETIGGLDTADWFQVRSSASCPSWTRPRIQATTSAPLSLTLIDPSTGATVATGNGFVSGSALRRGVGYLLLISPTGPGVTTYTADFEGFCS